MQKIYTMTREQQTAEIARIFASLPADVDVELKEDFTRALEGDEWSHAHCVSLIQGSQNKRIYEREVKPLINNATMSERERLERLRNAARLGEREYLVTTCGKALEGDAYSREYCRLALDEPAKLAAHIWENSPEAAVWKAKPAKEREVLRSFFFSL